MRRAAAREGVEVVKQKVEQKVEQKKVIVPTKRMEVVDDDGWTHVVDAPTRRSPVSKHNGAQENLQHGGDFTVNGVAFVKRTLQEMQDELGYWRKNWEKSTAPEQLKVLLNKKKGDGSKKISNVVVLGLGSLQIARLEGRRASHTQFAALETVVSILAGEEKIHIVFQDPIYTDMDKQLLCHLGHQVVEDPAGFESIGEDTLVYAIHCYGDVYRKVAEGIKPAILICTDLDNFGKFNLSETTEEATKVFEDIVDGCEKIDFPQLRYDFSDTKIYLRQTEEQLKRAEIAKLEAIAATAENLETEDNTEPGESAKAGEDLKSEENMKIEQGVKVEKSGKTEESPETDETSKAEDGTTSEDVGQNLKPENSEKSDDIAKP
ncbi:hypothetical protein G7Y89_g10870 [Cudoniella acicularis]|uniref:SRR1-like domain-containing protein n=1 Tax=Cudoniella acicularis TaxID=354080 RepID=A0A8H4W0I7_9HELO|nr:hypothetical protein G7Y89_g10870 [Cudoniella acicularis]